jgi:hypothetical protein
MHERRPGVNVIKLFSSSLTLPVNKLERSSVESHFRQVLYLQEGKEPTRERNVKGAPLGQATGLLKILQ